ncbi:MAG: hypothetical protein ABI690_08535 [Chloroflexota bacterium]
MGSKNPYTVEHVAPGIILERSADKELIIVNVASGGQTGLAIWEKCVRALLTNWPPDIPCLLLHDLHKINAKTLKVNLRGHLENLNRFQPDMGRRAAVILPPEIDEKQFLLPETILERAHAYPIQQGFFESRRAALDWILSDNP